MGVVDQTNQQAKGLAAQIAKNMAQQPFEVLGDAKRQVTGQEGSPPPELNVPRSQAPAESKIDTAAMAEKDQQYVARTVPVLETEMREIGRNNLITELQKRIGTGEDVSLESYNGQLPMETLQVLKAQKEAVAARMKLEQAGSQPLVQPSTKTPRGSWMQGGKQQAKKQETHVEKPVQSST